MKTSGKAASDWTERRTLSCKCWMFFVILVIRRQVTARWSSCSSTWPVCSLFAPSLRTSSGPSPGWICSSTTPVSPLCSWVTPSSTPPVTKWCRLIPLSKTEYCYDDVFMQLNCEHFCWFDEVCFYFEWQTLDVCLTCYFFQGYRSCSTLMRLDRCPISRIFN